MRLSQVWKDIKSPVEEVVISDREVVGTTALSAGEWCG